MPARTEYEAATLVLRAATLTVTKWRTAATAATVAIGLGQIAIVAFGIRAMQRAGEHRAMKQDQVTGPSVGAVECGADA